MTRKPIEWNVVVPGRWNPGILTPSGIATRIFKLPTGTPIEVQILVDDYQPFLCRHGHVIVRCGSRFLQVNTDEFTEESLMATLKAACTALEDLPQTPLLAAGINLKYEILEPESNLASALVSGFEDSISDLGIQISGRSVRLTLKEPPGVVNLEVAKDENTVIVGFNFHLSSTKQADLLEWLSRPASQVLEKVEKLFTEVLKVPC
jgi:hypothetical protein